MRSVYEIKKMFLIYFPTTRHEPEKYVRKQNFIPSLRFFIAVKCLKLEIQEYMSPGEYRLV